MQNKIIKSHLNYTGGKFALLPQLFPLFPSDINTFLDVFGGGGSVGINVKAEKIIINDLDTELIGLHKFVQRTSTKRLFELVANCVEMFGLSDSMKNGSAFYSDGLKDGVSSFNKEKYIKLRKTFNEKKFSSDEEKYTFLYVLIVFGFNNQIRFNSRGEFNTPVGKRDWNKNMREKLVDFHDRVADFSSYIFTSKDFESYNLRDLPERSFVYADPPYLISQAPYNGGWKDKDEKRLLTWLDTCDRIGIKFGLSNVIFHKGKVNSILQDWINLNSYRVYDLKKSYSNSSYQGKHTLLETREVYITNYIKGA